MTTSLREITSKIYEESGLMEPRLLAEQIAARVPEEDLRTILESLLPDYARDFLSTQRRAALTRRSPSRSWKVATIRLTPWESLCAAPMHVGMGRWKVLAECTPDDLLYAAQERREQAKALERRAGWFEDLAGILERYSVTAVSDLPEPGQEEVLRL